MIGEKIEYDAIVLEALSNARFVVKLDVNGKCVKADISGKMRKNYIRVTRGDKVKLSMNIYNSDKGTIIGRLSKRSYESKIIYKKAK